MAKVKVHLRIAESAKGFNEYVVKASAKPNYSPITDSWGKARPTAAFAIRLNVPEEAFRRAEAVLAELDVPEEAIEVAAEIEGSE